jgi:transcriptional regulator with XRE-family HTH domain
MTTHDQPPCRPLAGQVHPGWMRVIPARQLGPVPTTDRRGAAARPVEPPSAPPAPDGDEPSAAATLGDRIRTRRRALGWSQAELAARVTAAGAPLRQSDLSRIERGQVALPGRARVTALAATLALPFAALVTDAPAPPDGAGPQAAAEPSRPSSTPPAMRGGDADGPTTRRLSPRLAAAIAEAETTRARTAAVLRHCQETWADSAWFRSPRPAAKVTAPDA